MMGKDAMARERSGLGCRGRGRERRGARPRRRASAGSCGAARSEVAASPASQTTLADGGTHPAGAARGAPWSRRATPPRAVAMLVDGACTARPGTERRATPCRSGTVAPGTWSARLRSAA